MSPKSLGLTKNENGDLMGSPFWGVEVIVAKEKRGWRITAIVDNIFRLDICRDFPTRKAALQRIAEFGDDMVMTHNILNREFGEFPISRSLRGGVCDPAREAYHCM